MSENPENKKPEGITENTYQISDEETGGVSGGQGENDGYYMTVGSCNGYLALRPDPYWDQYNELAQLYPGWQVFTYGSTTNGTGLNGIPCTYTYVNYNGIWGWANSSFLH